MKRDYKQVYQFKIMLLDTTPVIWRRIQVPDSYTFWDLHVAIQDSMGWLDYHLHEFEVLDPSTRDPVSIGLPDADYEEILDCRKQRLSDFFSVDNRKAVYTYDFGDNWIHDVLLEEILPRDPSIKYPTCIGGERACPPEDVGGVMGYDELVKAMKDKKHPDREDFLDWLGREYDPEEFDFRKVSFDDPDERLKNTEGDF
jgi:hypothetical protein